MNALWGTKNNIPQKLNIDSSLTADPCLKKHHVISRTKVTHCLSSMALNEFLT